MSDEDIQVAASSEEELRKQAISSLKKKENFKRSLTAYVIVNAFLIAIWALTHEDSENFWPIWVMAFWGIGLAFQAFDAYGRKSTVSESQISEEMQKLKS